MTSFSLSLVGWYSSSVLLEDRWQLSLLCYPGSVLRLERHWFLVEKQRPQTRQIVNPRLDRRHSFRVETPLSSGRHSCTTQPSYSKTILASWPASLSSRDHQSVEVQVRVTRASPALDPNHILQSSTTSGKS